MITLEVHEVVALVFIAFAAVAAAYLIGEHFGKK